LGGEVLGLEWKEWCIWWEMKDGRVIEEKEKILMRRRLRGV
jgi:hypothetical protein